MWDKKPGLHRRSGDVDFYIKGVIICILMILIVAAIVHSYHSPTERDRANYLKHCVKHIAPWESNATRGSD